MKRFIYITVPKPIDFKKQRTYVFLIQIYK